MSEIRPLRESDRDDVLEIARNTWEGHDYLPYSFDTWLKDKNSHTAAIEKEGHVVALANLRVIENGKTGWMEGLRVHPNHRGKGLARLLTNHVLQTAMDLQVERIRYTTANVNRESLHLGETIGMKRRFDLAVYWHEDPMKVSWRSSGEPVQEVTSDQLYPDLIAAELLPCNVIIYDWKALDVAPEALDKIGQVAFFWIQSHGDTIISFSLGFTRDASSGPQWVFTIYANDAPRFLDHLSHNLDMAAKNKCTVFFGAFQRKFYDTLCSLDWVQRENDDNEFGLSMLERVF